VWFRIRIGGGSLTSVTAYFDYSLDGLNWVNLYKLPEDSSYFYFNFAPPCVGLFVYNAVDYQAIDASFDFFQMKPKTIN
ncbi:unnamed protein product, partial [marine sediment metagenome]